MELGYNGKVVGITGAASQHGIGFAIAKAFLREGAQVFICDIDTEAAAKAVKVLGAYGLVRGYIVDVSDEASIKGLFEKAASDFGKIDVFVNNAGVYTQAPLCDMTTDQWDKVLSVNLKSVFLCGREAFRQMKASGGVIINACSYAAIIGSAGSGAYAASKAAVYSLTKTMAAEMAPFHIRVNGFIPGVIETEMTKDTVHQRRQQLESQIALARLGTPEDVANAVTFLASDAASYITGSFIEISGGKLCVQNPDYGYINLV